MVELPAVSRRPGEEDRVEAPCLVPSATHVLEGTDFWTRIGRLRPLNRMLFLGQQALIGRAAQEKNEGRATPSFAPMFKPHLSASPLRTIAQVGTRPYSARDVTRIFLRELLKEVHVRTGERIRELVATTPVDAYEQYRAELKQLLHDLGVRRVRFVDEPVAAALGYGLSMKRRRIALVVDFGGGTLDAALVAITPKGIEQGSAQVLGKSGQAIGGNIVDRWLLQSFSEKLGYRLPEDLAEEEGKFWFLAMLSETRRVKEAVYFNEVERLLPTPPSHHRSSPTAALETLAVRREDVEEVLKERGLLPAIEATVNAVLAQAAEHGVRPEDIEDVLMVGGSTLLPGVYPYFEKRFGRDTVRAWQPFEAVAYGAATMAANAWRHSDFIVHDYAFVTHDLHTHKKQYSVIVPRGTRFPTAPDLWKRQLVPTCSLGEPEAVFKLLIAEVGDHHALERRFTWARDGALHKVGGESFTNNDPIVIPLNEANPTLGELRPPHDPGDKTPRLEIAFGVNHERWLCATVRDLRTDKRLMQDEPVVRLM